MKRKGLLPALMIALVLALGLTGAAAVYAAGGGTVAQAEGDAPAAITLNEHENKYYALPNGKGWTEMKTAYENALNAVNAEIKKIKDEGGDLAEAVTSGRIPFYSNVNDGYITGNNLEGGNKYGEKWVHENVASDALAIYNLTEGFEPTARSKYCALVVFNAKATDTTGTNGVVFVTGEFAAKWGMRENNKGNKERLGLATGARFTVDDTVYQNFQRGYLKKTGTGNVELVEDKNVNASGTEQAADLNAFGWYGASGQIGGKKNTINKESDITRFDTEEEVKAFSAMASQYYDGLIANGKNPGYHGSSEMAFGISSWRSLQYPVDKLYRGNISTNAMWEEGRNNWLGIAYNKEMNKLFLLKDEVVYAIEKSTNSGGNYQEICSINAPTSELFAVHEDSKRYQAFQDGYVEVDGLTVINNCTNVTVHKSTESGYVSLLEQFTKRYNDLVNGDAKEAAENSSLYEAGANYDAFKAVYDRLVAQTPDGVEAIAKAYDELQTAFDKLVPSDPTPGFNAAVEAANAINNTDKTYTGASFAAFSAAYAAVEKDNTGATNLEILNKTKAIRAAINLLVTRDAYLQSLPKISIGLHNQKFYAVANGKGWTEIKAAYESALNAINVKIAEIVDGFDPKTKTAELDAAVAAGTIPFYSIAENSYGFLSSANHNDFGEKWLEENTRHNAMLLFALNDGIDSRKTEDGGVGWWRSRYAAFMVLNAKADEYAGDGGVLFVTSKFVAAWDQSKLGMPNGNRFAIGDVVYQNFQKGYLKQEDGQITLVQYKNVKEVDAAAVEEAANLNVSGWYGAMGATVSYQDGDNTVENYKNTMGFKTEDEAKAFSQKASAYYDKLWASGYNPGYPASDNKDKVVFAGRPFREQSIKVDNLYHGDSTACMTESWYEGRQNWSAIAYNTTTQTFYLFKDEVLIAFERGDGNGNWQNIFDLGAPTSELIVLKAAAKRYQAFTNGYVEIDGLTPKTATCENVKVHNKNDEGYATLETVMLGYYNSLVGEAKAAYDGNNQDESYTTDSYTAFREAYAAVSAFDPTGKTFIEIAAAYDVMYAAYDKLIDKAVQTAYDKALTDVTAIENNDSYTYSADSYAAFAAAKETALAMQDDSSDDMIAKTEALHAAYALLVTTESQYATVKAEIDALSADGGNYTGTSFAAFKAAVEAVGTPTTGEAMYQAIIDLTAAKALLEARVEMSELGVSGSTVEVGEEITLTVGGNGDGQVTVTIVSGDAVTVDGLKLTAVKAGTVVLKVTKAGGDRYFDKSVEITVTVDKKAKAAPATPEIESVTGSSITVKAIDGAEYRLGADGTWQTSNVFEGLDASTEYTVYVRYAETDTHYASGPVSVTATTTEQAAGKGCGCGSDLNGSAWPFGLLLVGLAAVVTVALRRKKA